MANAISKMLTVKFSIGSYICIIFLFVTELYKMTHNNRPTTTYQINPDDCFLYHLPKYLTLKIKPNIKQLQSIKSTGVNK